MKMLFTCLLILTPFLLQAQVVQPNYTLDKSHTQLTFEVDHLVISTVLGRFDDFEGEIQFDPKSKMLVSIKGNAKATSINTNDDKRDKHLRSADFFEVEKYPELTFEANNLKLKSGKKAKVKGQLKIRDVTKQITFDLNFKGHVTDPWGTEKLIVEATAQINRKDFGLKWNETLETGGLLVGEKIKIKVSAQANLKPLKKE